MALIKCPKCGGNISDTAAKCVHCGADLTLIKMKEQTEREYSVLPIEEKTKIREEYDKIHPEYAQQEKCQKQLTICTFVFLISTAASVIICSFLRLLKVFIKSNGINPAIFVFLILAAVLFIAGIVILQILKSGRKKELYEQKKFVVWLKKEKNLTYNIILSEKDRTIYNSYKVN